CHGRTRGQVLDGVLGHVAVTGATALNQPVRNVHADIWVDPDAPQVLQLRNLSGELFGGQLGGQGHVEYGSGVRYDLDLKALSVRLDEVARHNHLTAHLNGLANAELY